MTERPVRLKIATLDSRGNEISSATIYYAHPQDCAAHAALAIKAAEPTKPAPKRIKGNVNPPRKKREKRPLDSQQPPERQNPENRV